jgi:hypothetical protein
MFDMILKQVSDLRDSTEFLEACDWDENIATSAIFSLGDVLTNFPGGDINSLKKYVLSSLEGKYSEEVLVCLLNIIDKQFLNAINIKEKELN